MAWDGYFTYDGTEFVNLARTSAYLKDYGWFKCNDDGCGDLAELLEETYSDPATDEAPWVDPDNVDSQGFYGFHPLSISGIENSTRESDVRESILDGGVPGRVRHGVKTVVFTGFISGCSDAAVEYGFGWLKRSLLGTPCGPSTGGCLGGELCYFSAEPCTHSRKCNCPHRERSLSETGDDFLARYERTLRRFVFNRGPEITSKRELTDGSVIWTVSFTGVAGSPWEFGAEQDLVANFPYSEDPYTEDQVDTEDVTNLYSTPSFEPGTPSLTETIYTNQVINPAFDPASSVIEVARNYQPDPFFTNGDAGYSTFPNGTSELDTTRAKFGAQSLKVTTTSDGFNNNHNGTHITDTTGMARIYARVWVYADPANSGVGGPLIRIGGSGVQASNSPRVEQVGEWVRLDHDVPVDGDGGTAIVYIYGGNTTGDVVWFDGLYLSDRPPSQDGVFDGDTPDDANFTYAWAGTAYASPSTQSGNPVADWQTSNRMIAYNGGGRLSDDGSAARQNYTNNYTATVGTPLTGRVEVTNPTAETIGFTFSVRTTSGAAFAGGHMNGTSVNVDPGETASVTDSITVADGEDGWRVYCTSSGPFGLILNDLIVVESETLPDYFDGDTPADDMYTYSWTGTPHRSASTKTGETPNVWSNVAPYGSDKPLLTTERFRSGTQSMFIRRGGGTTHPQLVSDFGNTWLPAAGEYRFTAHLWIPGGSESNAGISVRGPGITTTVTDYTTLRDQWGEVSVVADWNGADAFHIDVLQNGVGVPDDHLWVDDIIITQGNEVIAYFDGDTQSGGWHDYSWAGTPHNSTSVRTVMAVQTDPETFEDVNCAPMVYEPVADPLCPPTLPPPPPSNVPYGCQDLPETWDRRQFYIPEQSIPLWGDVGVVLDVASRGAETRNLRVRFYADPDGDGRTNPEDPCAFCGDVVVSYIPANSTLTFDSATEQVYIVTPGGVRRRADHLLFGSQGVPFEWPLLTCGYGYVVTLDQPPGATPAAVDLSLRARSA